MSDPRAPHEDECHSVIKHELCPFTSIPAQLLQDLTKLRCLGQSLIIHAHDTSQFNHPRGHAFVSHSDPPCSLLDYALRLGSFVQCSRACFLVAAALTVRLFRIHPDVFSPRSCHKLLAGIVIVAVKVTEDCCCTNSFFAACAGLCVKELNFLEREILRLLSWQVVVRREECVAAMQWSEVLSVETSYVM